MRPGLAQLHNRAGRAVAGAIQKNDSFCEAGEPEPAAEQTLREFQRPLPTGQASRNLSSWAHPRAGRAGL